MLLLGPAEVGYGLYQCFYIPLGRVVTLAYHLARSAGQAILEYNCVALTNGQPKMCATLRIGTPLVVGTDSWRWCERASDVYGPKFLRKDFWRIRLCPRVYVPTPRVVRFDMFLEAYASQRLCINLAANLDKEAASV